MILGLDRPTSGRPPSTAGPTPRRRAPLAEVGALLEAKAFDTGRSARNHLLRPGGHDRRRPRARRRGARGRRPGRRRQQAARAGSPSAWASGSASPPRCSATRRPSCSTSRSTASTPTASTWIRAPAQGAGRRGPHRLRLLAPDERDGADRRPPGRRRPRPGARRRLDGRLHRRLGAATPCGSSPRTPRGCAQLLAGRRRHGHLAEPGPAGDHRGAAPRASASSPPGEGIVLHELVDPAPSLEEAFMELTRDAVEYHGSTDPTPSTPTTGRTAA